MRTHPDKRLDTPREQAEREFNEVKQAYELLCDDAARGAWDDLAKVKREKSERESAQDDRRKRMRADLEERERQFGQQRGAENAARAKLKQEIDRLRAAAAERAAAAARGAQPPPESASAPLPPTHANAADATAVTEQLQRTLKLVWDLRDGDYTAARLRELFSAFGEVRSSLLVSLTRVSRRSLCCLA